MEKKTVLHLCDHVVILNSIYSKLKLSMILSENSRDVNEYSNVRIFAFHTNIRMRFPDSNIRIIFQPTILSCISLQEDSKLRPKVENNMTSHPACLLSNSRWSTF